MEHTPPRFIAAAPPLPRTLPRAPSGPDSSSHRHLEALPAASCSCEAPRSAPPRHPTSRTTTQSGAKNTLETSEEGTDVLNKEIL